MSKRSHLRSLASTLPKEDQNIANHLRFKAITYRNSANKETEVSWNHCVFCGSLFTPENCRVRLKPKLSLRRTLKKLLEKHQTSPEALSKYQTRLVERHIRSQNILIKTCLVCSKPSKFPAQGREWPTKQVKMQKSAPSIKEEISTDTEKKLTKKQKRD
uniref:Uncharacterized protein LOC111109311 n=1 Tax=Crassostrea virginica TaxID=6565 RepID=A0A8B8BD26_CRAVI|nr:uncharacterized protein LOC111109311 [Crassostrea virginica]